MKTLYISLILFNGSLTTKCHKCHYYRIWRTRLSVSD